jgi:hypothetical protein
MKKPTKVILGILLTVTVFLITFRAIDHEPVNTLSLNQKVEAIVENSGCSICHTTGHKMPWYAGVPLLGIKIKRDVKSGLEAIELSDVYTFKPKRKGKNPIGNIIPENFLSSSEDKSVKILRINKVLEDHSMPPLSFTILRPGSAVNPKEREIMLEWNSLQ